jgi:hypothetical protein
MYRLALRFNRFDADTSQFRLRRAPVSAKRRYGEAEKSRIELRSCSRAEHVDQFMRPLAAAQAEAGDSLIASEQTSRNRRRKLIPSRCSVLRPNMRQLSLRVGRTDRNQHRPVFCRGAGFDDRGCPLAGIN